MRLGDIIYPIKCEIHTQKPSHLAHLPHPIGIHRYSEVFIVAFMKMIPPSYAATIKERNQQFYMQQTFTFGFHEISFLIW